MWEELQGWYWKWPHYAQDTAIVDWGKGSLVAQMQEHLCISKLIHWFLPPQKSNIIIIREMQKFFSDILRYWYFCVWIGTVYVHICYVYMCILKYGICLYIMFMYLYYWFLNISLVWKFDNGVVIRRQCTVLCLMTKFHVTLLY